MSAPLVSIRIDGQPVQVPAGTNLIEAARQISIEVPHYCYHPRLTIAGNCRMCLVEVGGPKMGPDRKPEMGADGQPVIQMQPKLAIGCNTPVTEGMVVLTRSPKVVKARQGVMEFLLINHPLDCPICDQAGECRLQEFAVDYGKGESRFVEGKVHKPKQVPLGPKITLDVERCVMCSRCIRFMKEEAGQDCLGFQKRGSHVELGCHPGHAPDTNYDLNIVDICPVGALTSNDFRFRMRPWFLRKTKGVCSQCATGCNTVIWSREQEIFRQTPRENPDVNQSWMCDRGRLNYRFVHDPGRIATPLRRVRATGSASPMDWSAAIGEVAEALRNARFRGQGGIAAIGSARATTEEQFLFRRLVKETLGGSQMDVVPRLAEADGKLVSADRNSNTRGAQLTGLCSDHPGEYISAIAEGIRIGKIRTLLVLGENIAKHGIAPDLLQKLDLLVVIDLIANETTALADYVLPGVSFAEKRGTFINGSWRMQRFDAAITPLGEARPEWRTLAALLKELDPESDLNTLEDVIAAMAASHLPLWGVTWSKIGDRGLALDVAAATAAGRE